MNKMMTAALMSLVFVGMCAGAEEAAEAVEEKPQDPKALYEHYLANGMPKKEAMRAAAKDLGVSRRDIYNMLLEEE